MSGQVMALHFVPNATLMSVSPGCALYSYRALLFNHRSCRSVIKSPFPIEDGVEVKSWVEIRPDAPAQEELRSGRQGSWIPQSTSYPGARADTLRTSL